MRKTTQAKSSLQEGPKLTFLQEINREAESIIRRSAFEEEESDDYETKVVPMNNPAIGHLSAESYDGHRQSQDINQAS